MAEWLVEQGIGEDRAILVEGGEIRAARIAWPDEIQPGTVADAAIVAKPSGSRRGLARLPDGSEVLVDALPREVTEGMTLRLRITRGPIAERGRYKRALARPAKAGEQVRCASLLDELRTGSEPIRLVRPADASFAQAGWDELIEEALTGEISFTGGSLTVSPTPAMTVIDIDGAPPPSALALAAVPAIAAGLHRLGIGGSVGIDFPTLAERKDRQAVDAALALALADWQGERTAMNGFGFVQLVSRLERMSLLARAHRWPAKMAAQVLLRRAEAVSEPGTLLLCAHPRLRAGLPAEAEEELRRRTGRALEWRWDEALALTAPTVQTIGA